MKTSEKKVRKEEANGEKSEWKGKGRGRGRKSNAKKDLLRAIYTK